MYTHATHCCATGKLFSPFFFRLTYLFVFLEKHFFFLNSAMLWKTRSTTQMHIAKIDNMGPYLSSRVLNAWLTIFLPRIFYRKKKVFLYNTKITVYFGACQMFLDGILICRKFSSKKLLYSKLNVFAIKHMSIVCPCHMDVCKISMAFNLTKWTWACVLAQNLC